MAITLNVGGSKKVSQNFDSQGVSLNITAEVPNDALTHPEQIAGAAHDLFDLVNQLLDEQIARLSGGAPAAARTASRSQSPKSASGGNGRPSANGNGRGFVPSNHRGNGHPTSAASSNANGNGRKLTQAQGRAIGTMTRRLQQDADAWVHHEFGVDRVADLSVRQASTFIDLLKQTIEEREPQA